MGTAFQNSTIVKFNELVLFSNITKLGYELNSCGQIEEIGLDNITTWSSHDARRDHISSSMIRYAYLPNWEGPAGDRDIFFNRLPRGIRVGRNCTSVARMVRNGSTDYYIIESPMVVGRSVNYVNATYFFVHDDYVDAYKASSDWSSRASRIYPISSFREMFPNEPARMYEPW